MSAGITTTGKQSGVSCSGTAYGLAILCLEGAISDVGKNGAIVLCVFLVISLSVPVTIALFIMK